MAAKQHLAGKENPTVVKICGKAKSAIVSIPFLHELVNPSVEFNCHSLKIGLTHNERFRTSSLDL